MSFLHLLGFVALWAWIKYQPITCLLTHYLGTCYRVTYTDIKGAKHVFRIITKDPREAALVQLIFNKLRDSNDLDPNSSTTN